MTSVGFENNFFVLFLIFLKALVELFNNLFNINY